MESTSNDGGQTVRDRVIQGVRDLFGDGRFLWQGNNHYDPHIFDGTSAQRLPNKPHGLNGYTDYHNIAFLSSLNPQREHFKFLGTYGTSGDEVRGAIYFSTAYQSVLRTSIRNPADRNPKRIFVPDRDLANYLHELFPRSRVEKLELGIDRVKAPGRPRKYRSNQARLAAQRRKAVETRNLVLRSQLLLSIAPDPVLTNWEIDKGGESRAETPIESYIHLGSSLPPVISKDQARNGNNLAGTLYEKKTSPRPSGYFIDTDTDTFVRNLRVWHTRQLESKEEAFLISPAIFDPDRVVGSSRGTENILYLRHIWLDFEDGDLTPDELPSLFPDLRMVVTNSFRHTNQAPRFRAFLPTTHPMTPEAYSLLYDNIAWKLEDAGYEVQRRQKRKGSKPSGKLRSGVDWSKRLPTSLFYLPSHAQNSEDSFFHDHNEPHRQPIDPMIWLRHSIIPIQPDPVHWLETPMEDFIVGEVDQAAVDQAIGEWQSTPSGQGNHAFFILGVKLQRTGMDARRIRQTLKTETGFARSPQSRKDRGSQIPWIMKSLSGWRKGVATPADRSDAPAIAFPSLLGGWEDRARERLGLV